ncbi:hypothetical protein GN956_G24436 [Arapaima gigas]
MRLFKKAIATSVAGLMYSRLHGSVTLTPTIKGSFDEILWKFNSDKAVEYSTDEGITEYNKFRGRTALDTVTGELTVRDLQETDSGKYIAEVLLDGNLEYSKFDVRVIDAVRRPTVRCEQRDAVGILRCHSEGDMRQYRWEGPHGVSHNWSDEPIGLEISSSDSVYSCVVKNPVSEERSEAFRAQDCFTGPSILGGVIGAAVALTAAAAAVVTAVYCVRRRKRATEGGGEAKDEKTTLLLSHEESGGRGKAENFAGNRTDELRLENERGKQEDLRSGDNEEEAGKLEEEEEKQEKTPAGPNVKQMVKKFEKNKNQEASVQNKGMSSPGDMMGDTDRRKKTDVEEKDKPQAVAAGEPQREVRVSSEKDAGKVTGEGPKQEDGAAELNGEEAGTGSEVDKRNSGKQQNEDQKSEQNEPKAAADEEAEKQANSDPQQAKRAAGSQYNKQQKEDQNLEQKEPKTAADVEPKKTMDEELKQKRAAELNGEEAGTGSEEDKRNSEKQQNEDQKSEQNEPKAAADEEAEKQANSDPQQAKRAAAKTEFCGENERVDENEKWEQSESGADASVQEDGKEEKEKEKRENGAANPEQKPGMERSEPEPETKAEVSSQNPPQDDNKTQKHRESPAVTSKKEAGKVTGEGPKQEDGGAELNGEEAGTGSEVDKRYSEKQQKEDQNLEQKEPKTAPDVEPEKVTDEEPKQKRAAGLLHHCPSLLPSVREAQKNEIKTAALQRDPEVEQQKPHLVSDCDAGSQYNKQQKEDQNLEQKEPKTAPDVEPEKVTDEEPKQKRAAGLLTYGRLNGDITLTAALPAGFEEILWTHNSDKVVEFVKGGGMREFSKFRGRTTVNQETGELTVRNLQETDSGRFTAEVLVAGRLQNSVFDVKVVDAVRRPTVRCEQRDAVGILRCHSEGEMRQYRWEGPRNFSASWSDEPIGLEISSSDSVYSCVVKNPVSEERSEAFRAQDCFTGRSSHGGALVAAAAVIAAAVTAAVCSLVLGVYCVRHKDRLTAASFLMPSDGREDEQKRETEEPEERTCSTRKDVQGCDTLEVSAGRPHCAQRLSGSRPQRRRQRREKERPRAVADIPVRQVQRSCPQVEKKLPVQHPDLAHTPVYCLPNIWAAIYCPATAQEVVAMCCPLAAVCFLLVVTALSAVTANTQCVLTTQVGDSVTVPLGYPAYTGDAELNWRKKGEKIFVKKKGKVIIGKAEDINSDGSLLLHKVQTDQEGEYSAEVYSTVGQLMHQVQKMLCVTGETTETVYGLIGKDVQLDPKVTETLSRITWMKGNNKLAEWIRGHTVDYYGRCRTAGRCDLSETTGVLIMKELNPGDTGKYSVGINNKGIPKEFLLTVLASPFPDVKSSYMNNRKF